MVEVDPKGRRILDERAVLMITLFLSKLRKSDTEEEVLRDAKDVRDVLEAERIAGYTIFAEGALNTIKKMVGDL